MSLERSFSWQSNYSVYWIAANFTSGAFSMLCWWRSNALGYNRLEAVTPLSHATVPDKILLAIIKYGCSPFFVRAPTEKEPISDTIHSRARLTVFWAVVSGYCALEGWYDNWLNGVTLHWPRYNFVPDVSLQQKTEFKAPKKWAFQKEKSVAFEGYPEFICSSNRRMSTVTYLRFREIWERFSRRAQIDLKIVYQS